LTGTNQTPLSIPCLVQTPTTSYNEEDDSQSLEKHPSSDQQSQFNHPNQTASSSEAISNSSNSSSVSDTNSPPKAYFYDQRTSPPQHQHHRYTDYAEFHHPHHGYSQSISHKAHPGYNHSYTSNSLHNFHHSAYYNNVYTNSHNPEITPANPYLPANPYFHYNQLASHHHDPSRLSANVDLMAAAALAVATNPLPLSTAKPHSHMPKKEPNVPSTNVPLKPNKTPSYNEKPHIHQPEAAYKPPPNNPNIKVKLQDMSLWKQFNHVGTEMIITKCGRRMFPSLRVNVTGLDASAKYLLVVDVIPVDDNRYKYHNCEWVVSGKAEQHFSDRGYVHPDGPLTGNQWMKQIISFHKLKLTNNPFDRVGHIILNSMHKYVPRLSIYEEGKPISMVNSFVFHEAQFMAVTAYQNESITKLKIEFNPFAKGFRDGQGRRDFRAKRGSDDENEYVNDENANEQLNKYSKTDSQLLQCKDMNMLQNQGMTLDGFNQFNQKYNHQNYSANPLMFNY
jgi:hypothetical protein